MTTFFTVVPQHRGKRYYDVFDWPESSLFGSHFNGIDELVEPLLECMPKFAKAMKTSKREGNGNGNGSNGTDKFLVKLDVRHFEPEELSVRVSGQNLLVHGQHAEREDRDGWIERQFTRRYLIPDNCEIEKMKTQLNNGVLAIEAPIRMPEKERPGERTIPITFEKSEPKKTEEEANQQNMECSADGA